MHTTGYQLNNCSYVYYASSIYVIASKSVFTWKQNPLTRFWFFLSLICLKGCVTYCHFLLHWFEAIIHIGVQLLNPCERQHVYINLDVLCNYMRRIDIECAYISQFKHICSFLTLQPCGSCDLLNMMDYLVNRLLCVVNTMEYITYEYDIRYMVIERNLIW